MKKVLFAISTLAAMVAVSCNKESVPAETASEEPEVYEVKIGMGGAITFEQPVDTKATKEDILIGIDVWSCPENGSTYSHYAHGLYNVEDITVKLVSGYKYKFAARIAFDYDDGEPGDKIWGPFATSANGSKITNQFSYQTSDPFTSLDCYSGAIDLFYGEVDNFIPSSGCSVSIDMERMSYGLGITLTNFSEGYVTISLMTGRNNPITFTIEYPATTYYTNYALYGCIKSYSVPTYYEEPTISASLTDSNNVTVPLGSAKIKVMSNKLTKVKINASAPKTNAAFSFQYPEQPVADDGFENYEIGGDEVIDTPVE